MFRDGFGVAFLLTCVPSDFLVPSAALVTAVHPCLACATAGCPFSADAAICLASANSFTLTPLRLWRLCWALMLTLGSSRTGETSGVASELISCVYSPGQIPNGTRVCCVMQLRSTLQAEVGTVAKCNDGKYNVALATQSGKSSTAVARDIPSADVVPLKSMPLAERFGVQPAAGAILIISLPSSSWVLHRLALEAAPRGAAMSQRDRNHAPG
jgi:hypothetical protein